MQPFDKTSARGHFNLMEPKSLPGLSPIWLISLAMVCGIFLLISIPLLIAANAVHISDWIGFAGNVVGASMTIVAAAVAYIAVQRQVGIGLISREEERIEARLPGLRQIAGELQSMNPKQSWTTIEAQDALLHFCVRPPISPQEQLDLMRRRGRRRLAVSDEGVMSAAPLADHDTRQHLLILLQQIEKEARSAEIDTGSDTANAFRELAYRTALYDLMKFKSEIMQRIDIYQDRLTRIRPIIERYIDNQRA